MKSLVAIATLGFALSFSALSFGSETYSVFGVEVPMVNLDVSSEAKGLKVEDNFMSFYIDKPEVKTDPTAPFTTYNESGEQNGYSVFGVWVRDNTKS